eukprot:m.180951 g.180951  ORF g.180951 m.180951 type:complete len:437 (-) comp18439_c0_seq3:212-1522(-)
MHNLELWEACRTSDHCVLKRLLTDSPDLLDLDWPNHDNGGLTPLMRAAASGWIFGVETLAKFGANVDATDPYGTTALHYACEHNKIDMVRLLIKLGADMNKSASIGRWKGKSPFMIARKKGFTEIVGLLSDLGPSNGGVGIVTDSVQSQKNVALWMACRRTNLDELAAACDNGAEVNYHNATRGNMTPLMRAAGSGWAEGMLALMQRGADVNATDVYGNTALHVAVHNDIPDCVYYLLDKNARADMRPDGGVWEQKSVLELALQHASPSVVDLLKGKGGRSVANEVAWNACRHKDTQSFAEAVGIYEADVNLHYPLKGGMTLMMRAAIAGWDWAVDTLYKRSADVNAVDDFGSTALHVAVAYGHANTVELLLQHGADTAVLPTGGTWANIQADELAINLEHVDIYKLLKGAKHEVAVTKKDTNLLTTCRSEYHAMP